MSSLDVLMDGLALDVYHGHAALVGVNELPFFIQRHIARTKRDTGYCPMVWTIGEPTAAEVERRVEEWFARRYPGAKDISFYSNKEAADELRELLLDLAEDLVKHGR